jgi:FMN phosphatase YigB (HAD superfamily)
MTTEELIRKLKFYDYIFFDLDNTIYDEFKYINKIIKLNYYYFYFSKFILFKKFQLKFPYIYKKYGNNKLINKIYSIFKINNFYLNNDIKYAKIMKSKVKIKCFNWFLMHLKNCENISKNYVITNGKKWRQLEKLKLLNLSKFINRKNLVFANKFPKPSVKSLKNFKKNYSSKVLMIGDDNVDKIFSKRMNFDFCKINFKRNKKGFIDQRTIYFSC